MRRGLPRTTGSRRSPRSVKSSRPRTAGRTAGSNPPGHRRRSHRPQQRARPLLGGRPIARRKISGLAVRRTDRASLRQSLEQPTKAPICSCGCWISDYASDTVRDVYRSSQSVANLTIALQERNFNYSRGRGYLLRKHRFPLSYVAKTMLRTFGRQPADVSHSPPGPFGHGILGDSFVGKWQGLQRRKERAGASARYSPLAQESPEPSGAVR